MARWLGVGELKLLVWRRRVCNKRIYAPLLFITAGTYAPMSAMARKTSVGPRQLDVNGRLLDDTTWCTPLYQPPCFSLDMLRADPSPGPPGAGRQYGVAQTSILRITDTN